MIDHMTIITIDCPECCGTGKGEFDDPAFLYDHVKPCRRCDGKGTVEVDEEGFMAEVERLETEMPTAMLPPMPDAPIRLREALAELEVVLPKVIGAIRAVLDQIPEGALTPEGRLVAEDACELCNDEGVVEVNPDSFEPCPCRAAGFNVLTPGFDLDAEEARQWVAEVQAEVDLGRTRPRAEQIVNERWGITQ